MQNFLQKFDEIAGIETENSAARWLERIAFAFLILMVLSAPHSIAASQTAWLTGMFAWLIRLFIKPRPKLFRSALDVPLWAFFGWSVVSSCLSYAPDISINKLRGTALFLIFYFVVNNLRHFRAVRFLAFALILSCMVNVLWTPIERMIGRGVEIHGVAPNSIFAKAAMIDGDALLEANGKKINAPEDLIRAIEQSETTKLKFYRPDFEFVGDVKKENLLGGANALERLGIESWKKSRNWRSSGFFGHYATYAEVLQLIASLAFGLLIGSFFTQRRRKEEDAETRRHGDAQRKIAVSPRLRVPASLCLFVCVAAMSLALLLTVTRASQLAFIVSAFSIVFLVNRKMLLIFAAIILPLAVGGLIFLQQSRQVGFFDAKDDSTAYRQTMWRDGFRLWTQNARNFTLGVGMDSVQRYWQDWDLYDGGRLPRGHFHSTPLQLAVERGFPALLIWLWIVAVYARSLWRYLRFQIPNTKYQIDENLDKKSGIRNLESGIILGCLGGSVGFFTSGLVHYNLGDQEVAMVFFLLMGLGVWICQNSLRQRAVER